MKRSLLLLLFSGLVFLLPFSLAAQATPLLVGFGDCQSFPGPMESSAISPIVNWDSLSTELSPSCLLGYGIALAYQQLVNFQEQEAENSLRQARARIQNWDRLPTLQRGQWHMGLSQVKLSQQAYPEMWEQFSLAEPLGSRDSVLTGRLMHLKAKCLTVSNSLFQVEESLREAERLWQIYSPQDSLFLASLYIDFGNYYSGIGEVAVGLKYAKEAEELLERLSVSPSHLFSLMCQLVQAITLSHLCKNALIQQNPQAASALAGEAMGKFLRLESTWPPQANHKKQEMFIHKASLLFFMQRPQEAIELLEQVVESFPENTRPPLVFGTAYQLLAALNIDYLGRPELGYEYAKQAIAINRAYHRSPYAMAPPLNSMAVYHAKKEDIDSALHYVLLAQEHNTVSWKAKNEFDFPPRESIVSWGTWIQLQGSQVELLRGRFEEKGCEQDLDAAYEGLAQLYEAIPYLLGEVDERSIDGLLNLIRRQLEETIFLRKTLTREVAANQERLRIEFFASEHLRSLRLLNEARQQQAAAVLPDSLQERLAELRRNIQEINKLKAFQASGSLVEFPDPGNLDALEFSCRNQLDQLLVQLSRAYPAFSKRQHSVPLPDVSTLQAQLGSQQSAMLSYHLANAPELGHLLRIFVITADSLLALDVELEQPLDSLMNSWRTRLLRPFTEKNLGSTPDDSLAYLSHQLYAALLEPVEKRMAKNLPSRLIILPHQSLEQLPFDLLLIEHPPAQTAYKHWPYAMNRYVFSYAYGGSRWWEANTQLTTQAPLSALVMSPIFEAKRPLNQRNIGFGYRSSSQPDSLSPLNNYEEVRLVHDFFPGLWLEGIHARKDSFLKWAPQSQLIHLASHAESDWEQPALSSLLFTNPEAWHKGERCYLTEINSLHLQAELVSLSACETGTGPWRYGEGLISLSRIFRSAGAKSVVSTLWQVPDQDAEHIVVEFYRLLGEGMRKDEALRLAKQKSLRQMSSRSHPVYWGSFTSYGKQQALPEPERLVWWLWLAAFVGGGLLVLWGSRRQRSIRQRKP